MPPNRTHEHQTYINYGWWDDRRATVDRRATTCPNWTSHVSFPPMLSKPWKATPVSVSWKVKCKHWQLRMESVHLWTNQKAGCPVTTNRWRRLLFTWQWLADAKLPFVSCTIYRYNSTVKADLRSFDNSAWKFFLVTTIYYRAEGEAFFKNDGSHSVDYVRTNDASSSITVDFDSFPKPPEETWVHWDWWSGRIAHFAVERSSKGFQVGSNHLLYTLPQCPRSDLMSQMRLTITAENWSRESLALLKTHSAFQCGNEAGRN